MATTNNLQQTQPQLSVKEVQDLYLRQNFKNLQDYFTTQNQLLDFKFAEIIFSDAAENYKYAHGLNYVPKDILVTQLTGDGLTTFNLGLFDSQNLDITVTNACTLRFFYGTYWNASSASNAQPTDKMVFGASAILTFEDRIAALEASVASLALIGKSAQMYEAQPSNTGSGNGQTSYTARVFNTLVDPFGLIKNPGSFQGTSGTNTTFQLGAGTYRIQAFCGWRGGVATISQTKLRLYNVDTTAVYGFGTNVATSSASGVSPNSTCADMDVVFTLTAPTTNLQIQQIGKSVGTGGDGLGYIANFGDVEVYSNATVTRLA